MSLGVHFALDQDQERRLLATADDENLMLCIEEIEEASDEAWHASTDKAWDAIHRCLSDGTLTIDPAVNLSQVVLAGRHLHHGEDYIVTYLNPEQVRDLAQALRPLDQAWLHQRYLTLDTDDYDGPHGDDDFAYTWEGFTDVRDLFTRAAAEKRAIIFTADG